MKLKSQNSNGLKLTKAKLLAFGGLLFSLGIVTSVTTTYAWYSINQIGMISNLNLAINFDDTLELYLKSQDPDKIGEIIQAGEEGFTRKDLGIEGIELNDVSGMFQDRWLAEGALSDPDLLPKLYSISSLRSYIEPEDDNNGIYVQNVFYIKSATAASIYLDGSLDENNERYSYVIPNVDLNTAAAAASQGEKTLEELNDVVNAVRVSFLTDEGYIIANPGESKETFYAGILDLDVDGYYDIDVDGNEKMYGEYQGNVIRTLNHENDDPYVNGDTFRANHMPGANIIDINNQGEDFTRKKENSISFSELCYEKGYPLKKVTPICHIQANEMKRIVVTIYVEGWDTHMTDAIDKASFDISLSFLALFDQD